MNDLLTGWLACAVFIVSVRWCYFRLPLHGDTGFYVSNHTIVHKKFRFSEGWNAQYAGASKFIPEAFYSALYLTAGNRRYPFISRLMVTLLVAVSCGVVGMTCRCLLDQNILISIAAMALFAMISSEAVYVTYHETAEQFEIIPQFLGFGLIEHGLHHQNSAEVLAGLALWWIDAVWIKLPAAGGAVVLSGYAVFNQPALWPAILILASAGAGALLMWQKMFHASWFVSYRRLIEHEKYSGHRINLGGYLRMLRKKLNQLRGIWTWSPIIPTLALLPLCFWRDYSPGVAVYSAIVLLGFFFQAALINSYLIPFQPVMALLAAWGVDFVWRFSPWPALVLAVLTAAWLIRHFLKPLTLSVERLNDWSWRGHAFYPSFPEHNLRAHRMAPEIRKVMGGGEGKTFYIFGDENQIYMLVDRSYPTPIITATPWLDTMDAGWKDALRRDFDRQKPDFILSLRRRFEDSAPSRFWPFEARSVRKWDEDWELFECAPKN